MVLGNDKISSRQLYRMIVTSSVGITCMAETDIAVKAAGRYGLISLGIAGVMTMLYTWFVLRLCDITKWDWDKWVDRHKGLRWINALFLIKYTVMLIFTTAFLIRTIRVELLDEMGYIGICIPILVLLVYSLKNGIEARGRLAECVIYPILIQIVILAILGVNDMDLSYLMGSLGQDIGSFVNGMTSYHWWNILYGGVILFITFAPIEAILFLSDKLNILDKDRKEKTKKYKKSVWLGVITVLVINLVYYIILVSNMGLGIIAEKGNSVAGLAKDVKLPYLVFEKQDGIFMAFFILSIFFTIFSLGYHMIKLGGKIFGKANQFSYAALVLVLFTGIYFVANHTDIMTEMTGKKEKRVEIDNREYADSLIIDESTIGYRVVLVFQQGENSEGYRRFDVRELSDIIREYETSSSRVLDLSHVQAVIIGEGLLKDERRYEELALFLESREELSGSMNLGMTTQDADTFLNNLERMNPAPGRYISKMIENNDNVKDSRYKDMRLLMHEDRDTCPISVFTAVENRIEYNGQRYLSREGLR